MNRDAIIAGPEEAHPMKRLRVTKLAITLALVVTTSCATGAQRLPPLDTPSGRPEIFIQSATKSQALNEAVVLLSAQGFFVAQQTGFSLLLTKDVQDFGTRVMYGSRFNSTPQYHLRVNAAERDGGIYLNASQMIVTNPGSAFAKGTRSEEHTSELQSH